MHYKISYQEPLSHFVNIVAEIPSEDCTYIDLLLPAWRPGRYELANYAENIRGIKASDSMQQPLPIRKRSRNKWRISNTSNSSLIKVSYQYYANQLDAGGSLLNDQQLYLNFINCLLYRKELMNDPCSVELKVAGDCKIACGLPRKGRRLVANSYYQLVDAPVIASKHLVQWRFQQHGVPFSIWVLGTHQLNKPKLIRAFKAFSREQINTMGSFPEKEYHFLILAPNLKIYHGVEHATSTVIALGPGKELHKKLYPELLGVSSHELFHCWNVLRIRPKEMLPYDFSKETYFETGLVAEGVTTYYGDLFLLRSGVFNQAQYFKEIDKLFKRHFENEGRHYASLTESSLDLWVDGYRKSAPGRKVSIYTKGALVALMTDLTIRKHTDHGKSLDQVMRYLWENFGQKNIGYTLNDYKNICKQMAGVSLQRFFGDYVEGLTPLEQGINDLLAEVGCQMITVPSKQLCEKVFGFSVLMHQQQWSVTQVLPRTPAYGKLSEQDLLIKVNGKAPTKNLNSIIDPSKNLKLVVKRSGETTKVILTPDDQEYFRQYHIRKIKNPSARQREGFLQWLKIPF